MRKLKHYETYLKRLDLFAAAINVKIIFGEVESEGIWFPRLKTVKIDDNLTNSETIATILHELGHALDDVLLSDLKLHKAYHRLYNDKANAAQKIMVIDTEKKAWDSGRDIASRLNIRLGKWYDQQEAVSLKAYKDA